MSGARLHCCSSSLHRFDPIGMRARWSQQFCSTSTHTVSHKTQYLIRSPRGYPIRHNLRHNGSTAKQLPKYKQVAAESCTKTPACTLQTWPEGPAVYQASVDIHGQTVRQERQKCQEARSTRQHLVGSTVLEMPKQSREQRSVECHATL